MFGLIEEPLEQSLDQLVEDSSVAEESRNLGMSYMYVLGNKYWSNANCHF